jgi:hypothetical protein
LSSGLFVVDSQAQNVAAVLGQDVGQPVAIDFYCGRGGWTRGLQAAGWRVIGIDLVRYPDYPAEFVKADVRQIDAGRLRGARLFVASPPCREFSDLNRLFNRKVEEPNMDLVWATIRLAREAGVPLVMENVRGLQDHIGEAVGHYGPFYLWGDLTSKQIPKMSGRSNKMQGKDPSERAVIPLELAKAIGDKFLAAQMLGISCRTIQRWFRAHRATTCPAPLRTESPKMGDAVDHPEPRIDPINEPGAEKLENSGVY